MIRRILQICWEELLYTAESVLRLNMQECIYALLLGKHLTLRQYLLARVWLAHPACPEPHRLSWDRWPVLKPVRIN